MSLAKEFKLFATKGNVVDMAVGIIIGAAFGKIVSSLVTDVLMPPLGKLIGNVNFTDLFLALDGGSYETAATAKAAGAPIMMYGNFIQSIVDFVIVAFAIFIMIKAMNSLRKKEEAKPAPEPTQQEKLLGEIRDILKEK
ncbi:MAG: large-conductance mechanosensitive channel protein MscL [Bacteroidota bacterium]